MSTHNSKYIKFGSRNITDLGLKKSSAKLVPKGTVLFTSRAPIGYIAIATAEVSTNQGFKSLVCDSTIAHNEYIYYLLSKKVPEIESIASGSTFKEVSGGVLKDFQVELPSLVTQKKIAHILSTLDDKIELNRKMNKTLEEMAQALFKSWFVDFDPVHAKAKCSSDEELETAAKELGISKEILELFPSEFEESDLGMIPNGWEVKELIDVATVTMGQSPKGESYNYDCEGLPLLNGAADFSNGILTPTKYTTDSKRKAEKGELVFCIRATIGLLTYTDKTYSLGRGVSSINAKTLFKELVYLRLNSKIEQMKSNANGSVILGLSKDDIRKLKIIIGTNEVMTEFNKLLESMFEQITVNTKQIQTLQKTRDTLLPRLLSGELDVSNLDLEEKVL